MSDPLDNPIWHSLIAAHAHLAQGAGHARRYLAAVSPFVGLSEATDDQAWRELAALLGPGQRAAVAADPAFRGQGLAARLVGAVYAGIRERGDRPPGWGSSSAAAAVRGGRGSCDTVNT